MINYCPTHKLRYTSGACPDCANRCSCVQPKFKETNNCLICGKLLRNEHLMEQTKISNKTGFVSAPDESVYDRAIWNEAIETAAKWLHNANRNGTDDAAEIRKLKK